MCRFCSLCGKYDKQTNDISYLSQTKQYTFVKVNYKHMQK